MAPQISELFILGMVNAELKFQQILQMCYTFKTKWKNGFIIGSNDSYLTWEGHFLKHFQCIWSAKTHINKWSIKTTKGIIGDCVKDMKVLGLDQHFSKHRFMNHTLSSKSYCTHFSLLEEGRKETHFIGDFAFLITLSHPHYISFTSSMQCISWPEL